MLPDDVVERLDESLHADDEQRVASYPGDTGDRQPVHTVYVPADAFTAGTAAEWGVAALAALDEHGPLSGFDRVEARVRAKLVREPVEDLRIDVEDGYGLRPDADEDRDVRAAATALRAAVESGTAPPFTGLRMKSLEGPVRRRGIHSLDLFLDALGPPPDGFRVTLPKVTSVAQVEVMAALCAALEAAHGVDRLRFEIQVETPQAILGPDGAATVARMIHAAAGRCVGLHYGTYDYSASLGVAAAYQSMEHPAADHAKAVMQVAAAGTGVPCSDGSTNVLPVGDTAAVRAAWALHARLVRRSLERGFYQGWDMHPAQLPTRFAATYAFYRDGAAAARARLDAYRARSASGVLDEPATERALVGFLARGVQCGALDSAETA